MGCQRGAGHAHHDQFQLADVVERNQGRRGAAALKALLAERTFSAAQLDDAPSAVVADLTRRLTQRATATGGAWESTRRPSTASPDGRGAAER